jgi:hypothetical protein
MVEAMAKPMKEDSEAVRALEMKASLMTNLLRNHAVSVTKHKNSLAGHRKRIDTMFSEFQGYILEAEANLQTILKVAMGGDDVTSTIGEETETMLNTILFNKGCLADYAETKMREFVKWLLTVAEVWEGGQLEVKDVVEAAKKQFSEKFVRGLREDIFQESAWPKGSRFIFGLRWR